MLLLVTFPHGGRDHPRRVTQPARHTLGNYFDIWNQPLSTTQLGPTHGQVTAFVDGQPFTGDPRSIPLNAHTLIQLDVGSASPGPQPFTFPAGL
ncbi:MAG: hypothetical protein E6J51_04535 [Chloroflexi bacterium]|nr:MAG: hypothetical protein E6J51_04535 [Chloroflexota bacterium]